MTSPFLRCGCSSQSDLSASSPAAGNKNININNNINSNINININIRSGWGGEQDETGRRFDICLYEWCHWHYGVNVSCLEPLDHTKTAFAIICKNSVDSHSSAQQELWPSFADLQALDRTHPWSQGTSSSSFSPTCNRGLVFSLHVVEQLLEVAAIVTHPQAIAIALKKSLSTSLHHNALKLICLW